GKMCVSWMYDLAKSMSTPATVLRRLAQSSEASVRAAVATNPHTPVDLTWVLCRDNNPVVRAALARSSDLPEAVLHLLLADENVLVAQLANQTRSRLRHAS
ncbi:MAG: hypothetical protein ACRD3W_31740, partial [Terriglobales bacterium]